MTDNSVEGDDLIESEIGLDIDFGMVADGAGADTSEDCDHKTGLPRLLRYALQVNSFAEHIHERLIAEIEHMCPGLPELAAWGRRASASTGHALAVELDLRAARQDESVLRSLSNCVRLLSLPIGFGPEFMAEHDRVASALLQAFRKLPLQIDSDVRCDLEAFVFGWAALPGCRELLMKKQQNGNRSAAVLAGWLGREMAQLRINHAWMQAQTLDKEGGDEDKRSASQLPEQDKLTDTATVGPTLLVVCLNNAKLKQVKAAQFTEAIQHIFNTALPLVAVPELTLVRDKLLFEFPHATAVIDFALADLANRTTVRLRPLLLVGDPGSGKSRFARRLGEELGLHVWRTDASQSDGAVFAGTDRRWHSSDACHPLHAIARGNMANPLILLDELDKAGTRTDYGRLWDCLLGFLEQESSARYQDPGLQVPVNLCEVSYVATANTLHPLPLPLRDRFRVIRFPKPEGRHLDALLPAILADIATDAGMDSRWMTSLNEQEKDLVARNWQGGSVRRLRCIIEVILRERETDIVKQ